MFSIKGYHAMHITFFLPFLWEFPTKSVLKYYFSQSKNVQRFLQALEGIAVVCFANTA